MSTFACNTFCPYQIFCIDSAGHFPGPWAVKQKCRLVKTVVATLYINHQSIIITTKLNVSSVNEKGSTIPALHKGNLSLSGQRKPHMCKTVPFQDSNVKIFFIPFCPAVSCAARISHGNVPSSQYTQYGCLCGTNHNSLRLRGSY